MPSGTRDTAGINHTANQERYRFGAGVEQRLKSQSPEQYAQTWIKEFLAEGPVEEQVVKNRATELGFDQLLLMTTKMTLGIESLRDDQGVWLWQMPEKPIEESEANEALAGAFCIDRDKPGQDRFALTPEELKTFGIQAHEDYGWIRDPRVWEDTRVAPGRVREFMNDNPGSAVVKYKGDYVMNGPDLILVKRPRKLVEQMQARELMREQGYFGQLQEAEHSGRMDDDDFDPRSDEAKIARKQQNTRNNIETGRIGPMSPSSGMPYEDYIRHRGLSGKDIEAEEIQAALGLSANVDEVMAEMKERNRNRGSSGKFTSLPSGPIRPRNLAKKG